MVSIRFAQDWGDDKRLVVMILCVCDWRGCVYVYMCMLIYVCVCTCVYVCECVHVKFCLKTNVKLGIELP